MSPKIPILYYTNYSPEEFAALKLLRDDNSIIIKPANKGRAISVIIYADYRDCMLIMVADTKSYVLLKNYSLQSAKIRLTALTSVGPMVE